MKRTYSAALPTLVCVVATMLCCTIQTKVLAQLPGPNSNSSSKTIAWTEDFEAAVQHAGATNKPLLLHFYGDYCPPCKLLDKKTFHDQKLVNAINTSFVPVKINADTRSDLAKHYQVMQWPTDVYVLPNGDELYRTVSPQDPSVYVQIVDRMTLRHRDWTVEQQALAKAREKTQDRRIATQGPTLDSTQHKLTYSGNGGRPVKTHSNRWSPNNDDTSNPAPVVAEQRPAGPTNGQRTIENPYLAQIVPAAPQATERTQATERSRPATRNPSVDDPQENIREEQRVAQNDAPNTNVMSNVSASNSIASNAVPPNGPSLGSLENNRSNVVAANPPQSSLNQNNVAPSKAPATNATSSNAALSMDGYCPVQLRKKQNWIEGSPSFAVRHRGRIYYCFDEASRQTLLKDPDFYTPAFSGYDIVLFAQTGELVDGKCEFGCTLESTNRVFLFASDETRTQFEANLATYSNLIESQQKERVATQPGSASRH